MSRLPPVTPEQLDASQRGLYEQVTQGKRASGPALYERVDSDGSLVGPFNTLLHAPELGQAVGRLGEAIRYGSSLGPRTRELAILTVAAHHRSDFEWYAHERVGRHIGLSDAELRQLQRLEPVGSFDEPEARAYALCRAILRDRDVDDATYAAAVAALGTTAVVELVILVGYYQALALLLSAFHVPAPEALEWPGGPSHGPA